MPPAEIIHWGLCTQPFQITTEICIDFKPVWMRLVVSEFHEICLDCCVLWTPFTLSSAHAVPKKNFWHKRRWGVKRKEKQERLRNPSLFDTAKLCISWWDTVQVSNFSILWHICTTLFLSITWYQDHFALEWHPNSEHSFPF